MASIGQPRPGGSGAPISQNNAPIPNIPTIQFARAFPTGPNTNSAASGILSGNSNLPSAFSTSTPTQTPSTPTTSSNPYPGTTYDPNYDIYTGTYKNATPPAPMASGPTPYTWNQSTANSNDPNVYGKPGFSQNQNADLLMQQTNQQNNLAYQNYQNAYNNWLQNGAKGAAPQAPSYAAFDQNKFNQLWAQDQQGNGTGFDFTNLNQAINPGSVFANNPGTNPGYYVGGPGGTFSSPQSSLSGMGGTPIAPGSNAMNQALMQGPQNNSIPQQSNFAPAGFQSPLASPNVNSNTGMQFISQVLSALQNNQQFTPIYQLLQMLQNPMGNSSPFGNTFAPQYSNPFSTLYPSLP